MPKVAPTYSKRPGIKVYHNNSKCTERNNIENKYKTSGTGGKRLCLGCKKYNAAEK